MINYNYFEKIQYKNYRINDNININVLNTFNEFFNVISRSNLKYVITGSFGLSLISKKVYRTWKDIDILFVDPLHFYLKLFPISNWYYRDFVNQKLRLYNIKNKVYIEFLQDKDSVYQKKMYTKTNNIIRVANIDYIINWKKNIGKNNKHFDDINFFSKLKQA